MGTIEKYTEKTDIWSLGVLLYKCLSGDVPYKAIGCEDIYCQWEEGKSCEDCQISLWEEICQSRLEFRSNHWANVSDQAKHLVAKMLEPDVERRISAAEILDHPFIRCLGQIERENRRLAQNESANNNDNNIIDKPDCVKKLNLNEQTSNQKFEDSNISQEQKPNKSKTQEEPITDLAKLEAKLLFYLKDRFEFQLNDEQFYEVSLIENDYLYDSNQFNEDSGHPYAPYGLNY
jgi:serine/threonine protein kinase